MHFYVVGGYGEGRGRLVLEEHSERQGTQVGEKRTFQLDIRKIDTMKVVSHRRGCKNLFSKVCET